MNRVFQGLIAHSGQSYSDFGARQQGSPDKEFGRQGSGDLDRSFCGASIGTYIEVNYAKVPTT